MKKVLSFVFGKGVRSILFRMFLVSATAWLLWTPNLKILWIDGNSMAPSYEDKDVVLVQLNEYKEKNPKRFDPVVVWGEEYGSLLFKRVIGLPGEKIEIKKGHIFINDIELKDNFGKGYDIFWDMEPVIVPKNQYFIIGDNRGDSVYGFFMKEEILGKSLY